MWLFTKYGFYSVVCARQGSGGHAQPVDPQRMMIRARLRQHLAALQQHFPDLVGDVPIEEFSGTDYAYRMFVPKTTWSRLLAEIAEATDYDNFKSDVSRHQGPAGAGYLDALHQIWSTMYRLQEQEKR